MAHIITKLLRIEIILNLRYNKIDCYFSESSRYVYTFIFKFRIEKRNHFKHFWHKFDRLAGAGWGQILIGSEHITFTLN